MTLSNPLSFQLYSARNFPPVEQQLRIVAANGFTNVEPYGGLYDDVAGFRQLLARHGLTARSGHFGLEMLEEKPDAIVDIARELGMDFVVVPYLGPDERPRDVGGWAGLGRRLAAAAIPLARHHLRLAWHNHDFEFAILPDGSFPIEHILTDGVLWEADIAWIIKGLGDPKRWLSHYAGRVPLVHVKDIAPPGQNTDEDGWADLGSGTVPWPELWDLAVASGAEIMIAEHDNPSNLDRFARSAADGMRRLEKGTR